MPESTPSPPLDVLLYAHDGRGLGHVSRSVAIGLALRRVAPGLRTVVVTGARGCAELIGPASLDWIKLPAYATRVIGGRSRGVDGPSGFADRALGEVRRGLLASLVRTLRPRLALVDHAPQGKHRELLDALEASSPIGTRWLLGVRAVIGDVPQLASEVAVRCFRSHYRGALWYGDAAVLDPAEREALGRLLAVELEPVGYVSRLAELEAGGWLERPSRATLAGTVAVPWVGEQTAALIEALSEAIGQLGPSYGRWQVFVDAHQGAARASAAGRMPGALEHCEVRPAGAAYAPALLASRVAVVFGGYNSLTDVLHARIPALVILRGMADGEQERHVARLVAGAHAPLVALAEGAADARTLHEALEGLLRYPPSVRTPLRLDGAAATASRVARVLAHTG
jgi:predicted glycosyltransferase